MAETTQLAGRTHSPHGATSPAQEDKIFIEVLRSLLGKTVTIVNPESYEYAPVGHQLRASFYRAKPVALGRDYLVVRTERELRGGVAEPVKQVIPLERIKRLSLMKSELVLHL